MNFSVAPKVIYFFKAPAGTLTCTTKVVDIWEKTVGTLKHKTKVGDTKIIENLHEFFVYSVKKALTSSPILWKNNKKCFSMNEACKRQKKIYQRDPS